MVRNYHSVALIPVKSVLPFHLSLSLSLHTYTPSKVSLRCLSRSCPRYHSLSHAPPFSVSRIIMLARPLNHLGFLALIASSPHRLYIGLLHRASPLFRYIHRDMDRQRRATCSLVYLYIYLAHLLCIANDRKRAEVLIDFSTREGYGKKQSCLKLC